MELHKGHQALFEKAREIATEQGLKIAVLTFPESPKLAFVRYQPELMLHLASPEDRMAQLESLGVDYLYLIDFTSHFAGNTARDFFEKYVSRLRAKAVVAGFDYNFLFIFTEYLPAWLRILTLPYDNYEVGKHEFHPR